MRTESQDGLLAELAGIEASIERDAAAAEEALTHPSSDTREAVLGRQLPEHQELSRQLAALRDRVARAQERLIDPRERRAELATLSFFAEMLRGDAEAWRAVLQEKLAQARVREVAVWQERERRAAQREELLRRRNLLQERIDQAAREMAATHAECRRTVPVIPLADTVTVASITVSRPRRGLRAGRLWLVTLAADRDQVLVKPE